MNYMYSSDIGEFFAYFQWLMQWLRSQNKMSKKVIPLFKSQKHLLPKSHRNTYLIHRNTRLWSLIPKKLVSGTGVAGCGWWVSAVLMRLRLGIYVMVSPLPCSGVPLWFVVNVPSTYLAGITAFQEEWLSRPFVQKASGEQGTKQATTPLRAPV